ncbi:MAG: serine/threonine protein kinase [Myxococcales bacterium]|nr:serine/threonine protein kinase [Myxococcales bacterium]
MTAESAATGGRVIPSELVPGVSYLLERQLGEGGMAVAYLARRQSPSGSTPVVLKITRPETMLREGQMALTSFRKEAVALGRLNEQVPPNPCVVRLVDTGELAQQVGKQRIEVPWLALEYVHGGAEGTTLFQRMTFSLSETKSAFDAGRAARAIQCIASGLSAIHEVGVVHRDLSPSNVLCCGFGEAELFKIADFGIARAEGVTATFGDIAFGTPGYSAPEQTFEDPLGIGPWSDVFSLAAIAFYILTGEDYFPVKSATDCLLLARGTDTRRRLQDCPALCEELKNDPKTCQAIDELIREATQVRGNLRPQRATAFATMLVPWLSARALSSRSHAKRVESVMSLRSALSPKHWAWSMRHPTGDDRVIRSAAWGGDGQCLVSTAAGLEFWNGEAWVGAPGTLEVSAPNARIVHRLGPGEWLLADDQSRLAVYSSLERPRPIAAPRVHCEPIACNGDPDDLFVLVGLTQGGPVLQACSAGRWLKPMQVPARYVAACSRVSDEEWLIAGRSHGGSPYLGLFRPLLWELESIDTPPGRALVCSTGSLERNVGVAAGSTGLIMTHRPERRAEVTTLPGAPDISSVALDVLGREWAASLGRLWVRDLADSNTSDQDPFDIGWEDPSLRSPFVSLYADAGMLMALTVDGAIVEGRSFSTAVTKRSSG